MATTWEKIRNAGLRQKLAWAFAVSFSLLFGLGFSVVYLFSEKFRKQEFYQRLKDRTLTTYHISIEVDQINNDVLHLFDRNTVNNLYEEKILLFDSSFRLLYKSTDVQETNLPLTLLEKLRNGQMEMMLHNGENEVVGIRFEHNNKTFYGIAEAYDRFGRRKIEFLALLLLVTYLVVLILTIIIVSYLSRAITEPIIRLTNDIEEYDTNNMAARIQSSGGADEVALLANKFNALLDRVENAFKFQYHFIHHVSHELKTPLAVMISNIDSALSENRDAAVADNLNFLKHRLMEMAHIINAMLEISKAEYEVNNRSQAVRIDELAFECVEEMKYMEADTRFYFDIDGSISDDAQLTVWGNSTMLKIALMNILKNAVNYATSHDVYINLAPYKDGIDVRVQNDGEEIPKAEREKIFTHLFRGVNSNGKKGFGLGLVLTQKIVSLHHGSISYQFTEGRKNLFSVVLPLSGQAV